MNREALTLSLAFLLAALVGALLLVADFWLKLAPAAAGPAEPGETPTLDGVVEEGEYAHRIHDETTQITLSWTLAQDRLFLALQGPGQGWLAVGFEPDGPLMKGADILIGYVQDGQVHLEDHYADAPTGHRKDVDLGGTDDLLAFAGGEDSSGTTLELTRPLTTADAFDKPIGQGPVAVQVAYADGDDWIGYHGMNRATLSVDFYGGSP